MKLSNRALVLATAIGTVLQIVMVTLGHASPEVKGMFAIGGMAISLVAGILYAVISTEVLLRDNVVGGLIAGDACAVIGILVSFLLGDVPGSVFLVGVIGSAATGALGGYLGRLFSSGRV